MAMVAFSKQLRTLTFVACKSVRYSSSSSQTLQDKLRHLMVHCAQPVALVTTRLTTDMNQDEIPSPDEKMEKAVNSPYGLHGATISSFSSIAMYPHPLIAFSLQLPSRMASALESHTQIHTGASIAPPQPHFVINLLSTAQKDLAHRFSRPDLYPYPFAANMQRVRMTVNGQPMLKESVGCISCAVVHSLRLDGPVAGEREGEGRAMTTSELFIARVIRIETPPTDAEEARMPLVYFRKAYTTVAQAIFPNDHGA